MTRLLCDYRENMIFGKWNVLLVYSFEIFIFLKVNMYESHLYNCLITCKMSA